MRPFHRRFGRYVGWLEPAEASLIADLVDQVRQLLAARRTETPADPLAELTGMTVGPTTPPLDPAVARLLPDFHADDAELSAGLRVLHEPDLIAAKDAAAVALLDSLPRGGGQVRLDEDTAGSWIAALNDVRLALGVRLEITDDDALPPGVDDPESAEAAMFATYRWLSAVQDSLVTALLD
ncbi:DUF2017 domain-containing protein [Nakamurella sp. GG22]